MYVELHNPDAQLLVNWTERQLRQRDIMIRRYIHWSVRKSPDARSVIARIDAALKQNARDYAKSAP